MSFEEVGRMFGVSGDTAKRWVMNRDLPATRLPNGRIVVPRAAAEARKRALEEMDVIKVKMEEDRKRELEKAVAKAERESAKRKRKQESEA